MYESVPNMALTKIVLSVGKYIIYKCSKWIGGSIEIDIRWNKLYVVKYCY